MKEENVDEIVKAVKQELRFTKPFAITSVCRADIAEALGMEVGMEVAESLTDQEMVYIAGKMADDYCEQLFWEHLPFIVKATLKGRKR